MYQMGDMGRFSNLRNKGSNSGFRHQNRWHCTLCLLVRKCRHPGLQLWTFQANREARRFYERHGFTAVEETDGTTNEERLPDMRYKART